MKKFIKPSLILLPNLLDQGLSINDFFPANIAEVVLSLDGIYAESEKLGRKYLGRFMTTKEAYSFPLLLLNEHTNKKELESLFSVVLKKERWAVVTDGGLPCLADPGSSLVSLAHKNDVFVETYPGPCSMVFALQLSGFNTQSFSFHGYLPRKLDELKNKLVSLQKKVLRDSDTQIWIEAPYRTDKMIKNVVQSLSAQTVFCVAIDLSMPTQRIIRKTIGEWREENYEIGKKPAIFLIGSDK
jgi:16S rRNA (cytidine1402-2'-O)-methyltransferase